MAVNFKFLKVQANLSRSCNCSEPVFERFCANSMRKTCHVDSGSTDLFLGLALSPPLNLIRMVTYRFEDNLYWFRTKPPHLTSLRRIYGRVSKEILMCEEDNAGRYQNNLTLVPQKFRSSNRSFDQVVLQAQLSFANIYKKTEFWVLTFDCAYLNWIASNPVGLSNIII